MTLDSSNSKTTGATDEFDWKQIKPIKNPATYRTGGLDPTQAYYARRENETYNSVLAQNNRFCSALAYIRYMIFQMSRPEFGQQFGVDKCSMADIENAESEPFAHLRYVLYHRLLNHLEEHLNGPNRPLIPFIVNHLLGNNRDTVYGVFQECEYRMGHKKTGYNLANLRAMRDTNAIIPYAHIADLDETHDFSQHGMDRDAIDEIWEREAMRIYCDVRDVPEPLARLHTNDQMMQLDQLTRDATRVNNSCKRSPEFKLARMQMPPIEDIWDIVQIRIAPEDLDEFVIDYTAAYEAEREPLSLFWGKVQEVQTDNKVSDYMLKVMMNLPTDLRPSKFMLDPTIEGKDLPNTTMPPGILSHLVANSEQQAEYLISLYRENRTRFRRRMGVANAGNAVRLERELWGIKCSEIVEWIDLELTPEEHREAEEAGVLPDIKLCWQWGLTARQINKNENGQMHLAAYWDASDDTKHAVDEDGKAIINERAESQLAESLVRITKFLGHRKLKRALDIKQGYTQPRTVQELIVRTNESCGARVPWEFRHLQDHCREQLSGDVTYEMMNRQILRRTADQIEVPTWHFLKQILLRMNIHYTEDERRQDPWMKELKLDWQRQYARQMAGQIQVSAATKKKYEKHTRDGEATGAIRIPKHVLKPTKHQPLARVLHTAIAECGLSMAHFAKRTSEYEMYKRQIPPCMQTCNLSAKKLQKSSNSEEWRDAWDTIRVILGAADIHTNTPRWHLVECLFDCKQDTDAAIAEWRELVPPTKRKEEDLAGLLPEEKEMALGI